MKLASFIYEGRKSFGFIESGRVFDLSTFGCDLKSAIPMILAADELEIARLANDLCDEDQIEYLPPIPNPGKMLITGWNYQDHAKETKTEIPQEPVVLARYADSVVGHNQVLIRTDSSPTYDFEGELAVIIGKAGRRIPREQALDHVLGFSCFMEGSVRQYQGYSPTAGKNFYHSGAFGPTIVTGLAEKYGELRLQTILNGEVVQEAIVSDMVYDVQHLISHISEFTPLSPGDVIATGTPAGVGARREPKLWLKEGDVIEVSISRVGRLVNRVVDEMREESAQGAAG